MSENFIAQTDGDHYQAGGSNQHWDLSERFDVSYLEAIASKHLTRWRSKGEPALDLQKTLDYLDKWATFSRPARRLVPWRDLIKWLGDNAITGRRTRKALILILQDGSLVAQKEARTLVNVMLTKLRAGMSLEEIDG